MQEGHRHEKPLPVAENQLSNQDIEVSEEFLGTHEELVLFCIYSLVKAALQTPGAIDADAIAALEALIQTHRTLESGLVYETKAENSIAASIQREFAKSLSEYEKLRAEREPLDPVRNSEFLAVLAFLHRLGEQNQNGRPRGRMYLDLLRQMMPDTEIEVREPSIIL